MQFISERVGQLESVSLIGRFRVLDRGKRSSRCEVIIDKEMVLLLQVSTIQSLCGRNTVNFHLQLAASLITLVLTGSHIL